MRREFAALIALALSLAVASQLMVRDRAPSFSETYPAVVCPPTLSGLSSQISISSRKTQFQYLENKSSKTIPFNMLRYPVSKSSLVISALGVTPVVWQSRSGSWAGGAICSGPASSQWFVGGSSDVVTRGRLAVINSGLSDAIVDIQTFSENGKQPLRSLSLKSKSFTVVSLDLLATGDKKLAVHVVARSGRINSFMIDERGSGLKALGGDLVNPITSASKLLVIPAIPNQLPRNGQKTTGSHTLRILTTSNLDATFTLELISADGSFVPVGFNSRTISAGIVTEILFSPKISTSAFAVRIKSNEPVVAAISSNITVKGRMDFVWSVPTPALEPMTLAVTGLSPLIVFAGESIDVKVLVTFINGKKISATIKGNELATWRVPDGARSISILQASSGSYAGALVASSNGYGFIPITGGSLLTKVEVAHSNIRILNP